MKKVLISVLILLFVLNLGFVSSGSIDDEFKKLANYAGEYETGNIDYVKLLVYSSAVRQKMNEVLGATGKEMGGVLKADQLNSFLGEPTEETKWVWMEGEEKEKKMDEAVPAWRKVIFDGKKIQIRLNAWPSIFSKKEFKSDEKKEGENGGESEKDKMFDDLEGKLIYRLNFEIEFKKPEEQLNIQSKISDIQTLAKTFSLDPSSGNAETLAKESVNAERTFESYFRQSGGKCEDAMSSIFGTENKRQTQQMFVQEVSFCEGENYEVIARLEMCDECEGNWINVDFRVEGRGPGFKFKEGEKNTFSSESFKNMNSDELEREIGKIIGEIKQSCDNGDFNSIMNAKNKLWPLNDAWNQKSNDVWKELDKIYNSKVESMTQEQRQEFDQNYGWIKQEQEKRQKAKELSKANYEKRKQFYLTLFSSYDKKEYYFTQIEFQKRLIEEFKERGEEICDNNNDDNRNGAIDCADEQCGGKICGKGKNSVQEGNETRDIDIELYCIEKVCKAREEIREIVRNVSAACLELSPIECSEGSRVFFSRYDNETNCPIETSCLEETESCKANEDCRQPACGIAECIENKCEVTGLAECKELECVDGDERICEVDGRIVEICSDGFWEETGECSVEAEIRNESIVGNECLSANECGNDNVCNNGVCQMLPQVIITEPVEEQEPEGENEEQQTPGEQNQEQEEGGQDDQEQQSPSEQQTPGEQSQEQETVQDNQQPAEENREEEREQEQTESNLKPSPEPGATGNVVFNLIRTLFSKMRITGAAITGFQTEESVPSEPVTSSPESGETIKPEPIQSNPEQNQQQDVQQPENQLPQEQQTPSDNQQPVEDKNEDNTNQEEQQRREEDDERRQEDDERRQEDDERRQEDDERRQKENEERCKKECVRPCIEKCIRTECGEELNCVVDEARKKCERNCEAGQDCIGKCAKGGDWWKEFENKDEHKEEKGVFQIGGNCRTSQGKTEGFIWFGGWGEPFEQIQNLKNIYYSGGQADWCKYDFENLKKQRQEFEKGFNQEFVAWFFEKHLANSAENWEQSVSGIFELYWKDVDNSREMAFRMDCLGINELPSTNLINVKYETEYGSIEFWEEIKTVKLPGMDKEMQVISPYMKAWVFPSKEFIIYEMKRAMKNHEFPGSPEEKMERKNEDGSTAEEREMIKQDKKFMGQIKKISDKYGGNLDVVIRFVDNGEVVFNLYAQVNENDIMKIKPMLPEEVPEEDVRIEIEFQKLYDIIYMQEKEMGGQRIESPPWDKKAQPMQKIKDVVNGVKMYFKARDMLNSAKISPEANEKDARAMMKSFFSMMMSDKGGSEGGEEMKEGDIGEEKGVWEEKEKITGQVIFE